LKVVKHIKDNASRFTFDIFHYDNMFAPIKLGENTYGCVEIFKDAPFSSDDARCFQTIAQQVALPLKSASLYQEIKETNLKLEKLERLKSEFISIVSHELRTPLTSIKNSLDILMTGKCGEINDAGSKFLNMAKRNVQRLAGIINDLLDLSKIEAGKMDFHFKNINIHQVIDYVKSTLSILAKDKNIELLTDETDTLPEIYADSQRLEQVLTNLVSNAIKFTPEGKKIIISSKLTNAENIEVHPYFQEEIEKLKGDYIVVSVKDEGIGIAEKDLLHAFDKFAQIENSLSRKVGGSGLGLPIAKQLLDAHNGAIWCSSQLEKGSEFSFAIPVAITNSGLPEEQLSVL
uniref:ATP-binding protein n=1 Tax=Candidatus Scatousia sp. TaxID=3085663 RepID=UPI0040284292